jgi:hypothetical protein
MNTENYTPTEYEDDAKVQTITSLAIVRRCVKSPDIAAGSKWIVTAYLRRDVPVAEAVAAWRDRGSASDGTYRARKALKECNWLGEKPVAVTRNGWTFAFAVAQVSETIVTL